MEDTKFSSLVDTLRLAKSRGAVFSVDQLLTPALTRVRLTRSCGNSAKRGLRWSSTRISRTITFEAETMKLRQHAKCPECGSGILTVNERSYCGRCGYYC